MEMEVDMKVPSFLRSFSVDEEAPLDFHMPDLSP
jgi:hypothetical protein